MDARLLQINETCFQNSLADFGLWPGERTIGPRFGEFGYGLRHGRAALSRGDVFDEMQCLSGGSLARERLLSILRRAPGRAGTWGRAV